MTDAPLILWFRRDLRLGDHPMLMAALATGRPVVPVFILDPETEALAAAPKWRLGLAIARFDQTLADVGLRLILRHGAALAVLRDLVAKTGAVGVYWSRLYDPALRGRDEAVKAGLAADGHQARSFAGFLLHEPWTVATQDGGFYKVFTPFWRAVRDRPIPNGLPRPGTLRGPDIWPESDGLDAWAMGGAMQRGAAVVAPYQQVGEQAAVLRLDRFLDGPVTTYAQRRDYLAEAATSGLSENLTYGEIGPRQIWHAGWRALQEGQAGAEAFLRELIWREFAWYLAHNTPHITVQNWRADWDDFAWRGDSADAERWRRGMTGEPLVDAAMREMYVTGTMHNRARMVVASYLTKHLLTDWRVGQAWFAECLTDWDAASNAMGWQWVAGSGPDAAPFFRIFNPATQATKFDADGRYRQKWLGLQDAEARSYYDAVPRAWGLAADQPYPAAMIALDAGRTRALAALAQRRS